MQPTILRGRYRNHPALVAGRMVSNHNVARLNAGA
jgi:hypothetical protein